MVRFSKNTTKLEFLMRTKSTHISQKESGICRRKDLFITDAQGRVLTDFNLANYSILKKDGFNDELNLYNTGEVSDSLLESSYAIEPKETENLTADDIKEAFGTLAEKKDWDDML